MLETYLETFKAFTEAYPYATLAAFAFFALLASYILVPIFFKVLSFFSSKTKTDFDDILFSMLQKPTKYSLSLVIFLLLVTLANILPSLESLLFRIVLTALIIIWVKPLSHMSAFLLHRLSLKKRSFVKPETLPLFKNMALVIVWSLAVYFAFLVWGISLTAWLASAGIVGIAIGFAAKDTLANLISGIFILADSPYKVGDIIVLDSGEKGEVIHVGLRSTRIKTFDGVEITVPNANMGNSKIVNETGTHVDKKVRLRVPVGISYEDDIEKAEDILLNIAKELDSICDEPKAQVRFLNFGPSSLDLELRVWVKEPTDKGKTLDFLNRRILEEFRKAEIEIPYSKMDIYIKEHEK